jgi:hypothetical protein
MTTNIKNEITPEQIAQHFKAMGDSVQLIKGIIDGIRMQDDTDEERVSSVSRNIEHIEIMVNKDFWTDEDLSEVQEIITIAREYISN